MILLNTFIPSSLIISLELVKLVNSMFIRWDVRMQHGADEDTGEVRRAEPRTTTVCEELGQVSRSAGQWSRLRVDKSVDRWVSAMVGQLPNQPTSQPANRQASQPVSLPASQPTSHRSRQPASQPVI
jgi:hypothetical protein